MYEPKAVFNPATGITANYFGPYGPDGYGHGDVWVDMQGNPTHQAGGRPAIDNALGHVAVKGVLGGHSGIHR